MKNLKLEFPNCPICDSNKSESIYEGPQFKPYGVKKCSHCCMCFLSPRPTESEMISLYQNDDYFSGSNQGYNDYLSQEQALRATFRRLLLWLNAHGLTRGNLLEVGCGFGFLLDEAKPFFDIRVGTDLSNAAVAKASLTSDHTYQGGIEVVNDLNHFDVIISTHVIEHLYHPSKFIQKAANLLRPGGRLLIATPDMGSYWRRLMGHRWPSFKLPEHVLYFDKKSLSGLLKSCGFESIQQVPYPHAFPVPLIASKLGFKTPVALNKLNVWLPATTIAFIGVKHG